MIDLSSLTAAERAEWDALYHDTPWYCEHAPLFIKDKQATSLTPLRFNYAQRYVWARLWTMAREGRLVRALIPKARQLGMTTAFLAHKVHVANTREGREMYVLMHDLKPARTAWKRMDDMMSVKVKEHEVHLPRARRTAENTGRLFEFETGSSILVESVRKQGVGRSETLHHVHATELPSWDDAETTMDGIAETVPELPMFESSIILESTSEGVGDWWYWQVQKAMRGDSVYALIFLPWWLELAYGARDPETPDVKRLWTPDGGVRLADALREPLTVQEEALGKQILAEAPGYGISFLTPDMIVQKLLWRRRKIQDRGYLKFQQEYPASVAESFQGSGRPVFKPESIIFHKSRAVAERKLVVDARQRFEVFHKDTVVDGAREHQVWAARESGEGHFHVWKGFEEGDHRYLIGGDPSSAVVDPSAIQVLKALPNLLEQVAVYHGHVGEIELAHITAWIVKQYGGRGLIVPEATGEGSGYVEQLSKLRWPGRKIYQREVIDATGSKLVPRLGFDMNAATRPAVVATIYDLLASPIPVFRHEPTLMEMEQFQIRKTSATGKPRPDHPEGGSSDLLMAWGMAAYARGQRRGVSKKPTTSRGMSYEASKERGIHLPLHAGSKAQRFE